MSAASSAAAWRSGLLVLTALLWLLPSGAMITAITEVAVPIVRLVASGPLISSAGRIGSSLSSGKLFPM